MSPTADVASPSDTRDVPWNDVVRFVRQLSHDLRNHLNAIELQSTFLAELAQDGELKPEVQRLREMTYEIGVTLQKLTGAMSEANPRLMSYRVADFVDDLRQKIETERPKESGSIDWDVSWEMKLCRSIRSSCSKPRSNFSTTLSSTSAEKAIIVVHARTEGDHFVFELREPKKTFAALTENWGNEPLLKVGRGHYGLGLHRVRVIVEAHQGQLQARYVSESSCLHTTITLPLSREAV